MTNLYRDELEARLMAEYRQELKDLKDEELIHHAQSLRNVQANPEDLNTLIRNMLAFAAQQKNPKRIES